MGCTFLGVITYITLFFNNNNSDFSKIFLNVYKFGGFQEKKKKQFKR